MLFHIFNNIRVYHNLNTLLVLFQTVSILKRPRTPPATPGIVDYQNTDHEQLMKRLRPGHSVEEVILINFCSIKMYHVCGFTYFLMPSNLCYFRLCNGW